MKGIIVFLIIVLAGCANNPQGAQMDLDTMIVDGEMFAPPIASDLAIDHGNDPDGVPILLDGDVGKRFFPVLWFNSENMTYCLAYDHKSESGQVMRFCFPAVLNKPSGVAL